MGPTKYLDLEAIITSLGVGWTAKHIIYRYQALNGGFFWLAWKRLFVVLRDAHVRGMFEETRPWTEAGRV